MRGIAKGCSTCITYRGLDKALLPKILQNISTKNSFNNRCIALLLKDYFLRWVYYLRSYKVCLVWSASAR